MEFRAPRIKRHFHATQPVAGDVPAASEEDGLRHLALHYGHERGIILEKLDASQVLLISLLDGQHTIEEIVSRVQAHDASITADEIHAVLDDLAGYGVLEDAALQPPGDLTPDDLTRYESQIRFFSLLDLHGANRFEMQARLKRARVAVLGLGGLGSNILLGLAAAGVGFLRGVDLDQVELGNLNRQVLYDVADIGRPKAEAAGEHLRRFNPNITVEPIVTAIASSDDIIRLIQDVDVVAMCADTPLGILGWMNRAAIATRTPFMIGGYRGMAAEIGPFVVPFQTSCVACNNRPLPEEVGPPLEWINAAFHLRHPNAYFVTATAAHLTCGELLKYLTGLATPLTYNQVYELDLEHFLLTSTSLPRQPACPACSEVAVAAPAQAARER
jgi:bacteriocin biosynthesis cyclodehydratase domain-containing protein